MEVIATHVSSDFDSFAGMIAAKKLFPEAEILLPSSINQNVRKFITLHEDNLPQLKEPRDLNINDIKRLIIIDTKISSRLGLLKTLVDSKKVELIIFDHHQKSRDDIGYGIDNTKKFGAKTTILVDIIKSRKIEITPLEATLFALGIYEDTGSFTFPNTSFKDFEISAFLRRQGANLLVISKFLNLSLSREQHNLIEKLIVNLRKINVYEKEIILSFAETDDFIEGLSVLTRKLGQVEDTDISICWVKMKEKIYVVARSDDPSVDVSQILEEIGGGGHSQASSAVLKDTGFAEIENKIISSLYRHVKKPLLAKDIMSYPIRVINEDESISSANDFLKKYGHSGIPIVDGKKNLAGIITRKDVDRAMKHGLSHAPVNGFKSRGLVTTGLNTPLDEVQRLMIENGIGRIPIVNRGEVVGIVTRKDVLRFLHGRDYLKRSMRIRAGRAYSFSPVEVQERLRYLVPEKIFAIFEVISNIAKEMRVKVYLVGGIVRDLLLDISNLDIDIVVEGNGIEFAQKLSEVLNARLEGHEKFKTAVVVLQNGQHIDIASARIEYYSKPASLPDVEPGSISQDLARRDFTINTLAVSLNKKDFGTIIDFFGARKDLTGKKIKVLHKMSFIEDPTRIFSAVRFEHRLGFKMDSQTERLAGASVEMNMFSELNGIRVRDELVSILQEKNPWKSIKRLQDLKALEKIGINIILDENFTVFLKSISRKYKRLSGYTGNNFEIWRAFLAAMFLESREEIIRKWCDRMKIRKNDTRVIENSALMFNFLKEKLCVKVDKYSDLYRLLHDKNNELLLILGAAGKTCFENILSFYKKVSGIKLEITGDDLKILGFKPSRKYKVALDRVLTLKLDGLVKSRQEELQAAGSILSEIKED